MLCLWVILVLEVTTFGAKLPKASSSNETQCSVNPCEKLPDGSPKPPLYVPPDNRIYNTKGGPVEGKINVHIVPHSHADTGWLITIDAYFFQRVYYIIDTVVDKLLEDDNRRFSWAEIAFFSRWWDEQPDKVRNITRELVKTGRLQFVNGGWCMHDEATPNYVEMVDQTTRGHQFLKKNFGASAIPRAGWQIDPFGHSATNAWLMSAEAGMQSVFWGRMDYQDFNARRSEQRLEWLWQGSDSAPHLLTFAGELYGTGDGLYSTWIDFDGSEDQVNDNPARHGYNVDVWVDQFIRDATAQAQDTRTDHQLWACGTDFQYQNADHWYHNLDKLIHYVNLNGTVNAFYSTPAVYTKSKYDSNLTWEVRHHDDIFPYADGPHMYWTGYFVTRPSFKKQVRVASNFLNTARQMEVLSGISAQDVTEHTSRPSPQVGASFTDSLEGTVGIGTHHDGMTGTCVQAVANDFQQRMAESSFEVEAGVSLALQLLIGKNVSLDHCNCNTAGNCLNISLCTYTTERDNFSVLAWNPLAQATRSLIQVPVTGEDYYVWSVIGADGVEVESQAVRLDMRTKSLPLMYVNKYGMNSDQVREAEARLQNNATHLLTFNAKLPPVGYSTFSVVKHDFAELGENIAMSGSTAAASGPTVTYGTYELSFDKNNELSTIKNLMSNSSAMPLNLVWGWYGSSVGNCDGDPHPDPPPPLECVKWCQTGDCSMDGPREPQNDLTCHDTVEWGRSGYCQCAENVPRGPNVCQHQSFTCKDVCDGVLPYCFTNWVAQESGAYIFRPNASTFHFPGPARKPTLTITSGPVLTEVRQEYSDWVSHVIRLVDGEPYVEVEWTVGPIPISTPWMGGEMWGKEVAIRYNTALTSSGTFYTDSNGREMMRREYNARPSTYPKLNVNEPIAGNYYPVTTMASINDSETELAVLVDVAQGVTSLFNGSLELMVNRRTNADDELGGGVLNETMCGCVPGDKCECAGLTMRGRHWIVMGSTDYVHAARRNLAERMNFGATVVFASSDANFSGGENFSALAVDLPPNVKLQTLTSNYASVDEGQVLLRLSHLYAVNEHSHLSLPVTVDLTTIFRSPWRIKKAQEMSLTANQLKSEMKKQVYHWNSNSTVPSALEWIPLSANLSATLMPMEVKTFLVEMEKGSPVMV